MLNCKTVLKMNYKQVFQGYEYKINVLITQFEFEYKLFPVS